MSIEISDLEWKKWIDTGAVSKDILTQITEKIKCGSIIILQVLKSNVVLNLINCIMGLFFFVFHSIYNILIQNLREFFH
jgi:hypothetical protein